MQQATAAAAAAVAENQGKFSRAATLSRKFSEYLMYHIAAEAAFHFSPILFSRLVS